jgi:hypothetical protein
MQRVRALHSAARLLGAVALGAAGLGGCASGPAPVAYENRTFYNWGFPGAGAGGDMSAFEQAYPPLDLAEKAPNPEYMGVCVLGGHVCLSRPKNWVIRGASTQIGGRYIEYVSPNQYIFAVYERRDPSDELWRDILDRYEEDVKKVGAEMLGARVPIATWNAQGRAYVVRRPVAAAKQPFISMSRELLLRSESRVVLVQIVHQGQTLQPVGDELYRTVKTLQVK